MAYRALQNNRVSGRGPGMQGLLQRGFSLVELMIAVALGLLIMVALIAVFLNVNRTNAEMSKTNGLIENGRFAIDLLQEDLSHAGYWGGYVPDFDDLSVTVVPGSTPTSSPNPCLAYSIANWTAEHKNNLIGIPVQSYTGVPTGCASAFFPSQKADSDVLVVRHADTCVAGVGACPAEDPGELMFQPSRCTAQVSAGVPYVLSNTGFDRTQMDCATTAELRKYMSNIYYIRNYAVDVGDGVPTLMRSSFDVASGTPLQKTAEPLIEGIEGLVVLWGVDAKSRCNTDVDYSTATVIPPVPASSSAVQRVDPSTASTTCSVDVDNASKNTLPPNRGDGVPESYVHCSGSGGCTVGQLRDAVSAKVYVLARSKDRTPGYTDDKTYALGTVSLGPFNDGYKRHVFQTTVRLGNVSGRRGTP